MICDFRLLISFLVHNVVIGGLDINYEYLIECEPSKHVTWASLMELDTKKWKPKNSWEAPPLFGSG